MKDREEEGQGRKKRKPRRRKEKEEIGKALGNKPFMVPRMFSKILPIQALLNGSAFQLSVSVHV